MILAAIDIGSNAARLLISEVKKNSSGNTVFTKLNLLRIPLRLGMDVFRTGKIGPGRSKMMIDSIKIFSDLMKIYKVSSYRACATSAMRDAKNGPELIDLIRETSGIEIEIISGDEEASLIYENHAEKNLDDGATALYIDVGGGSTELMLFEKGALAFKKSFNIGTLRLLNDKVKKETWELLESEVKKISAKRKNLEAIGSGGNINKVFSLSKTKDGKPVKLSYLNTTLKDLSKLTVEERMQKFSLREDRADVIVPALTIYTRVMNWGNIKEIYVPKISVADGLIKSMHENHRKRNPASGRSTDGLI